MAKMASLRGLQMKLILLLFILSLIIASKSIVEFTEYDQQPKPDGLHPQNNRIYGHQINDSTLPFERPHDPSCSRFSEMSNILVVVKTGATESYARIPTQLVTVLRCLPDFLIFSDMEQRIAGYRVHDTLDTVLPKVTEGNTDFDLYRRQQTCIVDQQACNDNSGHNQVFDGWRLDRYKNIHTAEKAYHLRPDYDWYLFIDADTYVLWNNLVQWLSKLKKPSEKHHYIGSTTLIDDFHFAHGGSGYILSQATMKHLAVTHSGLANQYDMKAKELCCGDYVLGLALNKTLGIGLEHAWPTINGENPHTIPYGPREWCHPLVTMHHMDPEDVSSDLYNQFVASKLLSRRDDWDNLSEDVFYLDPKRRDSFPQWQQNKDRIPKLNQLASIQAVEMDAHKSFEDCRKMCESVQTCFQFSYHNGACAYNRSFKLGKPTAKAKKQDDKMVSGWNIERIRSWDEAMGPCKKPVWPDID
ncbi:glycosyltransferase family 31 protein [Hypoxylon sp. CI-4A]|nr:glycosyltransferase family 31 protein [Hypoxylon sp. CI-4A]